MHSGSFGDAPRDGLQINVLPIKASSIEKKKKCGCIKIVLTTFGARTMHSVEGISLKESLLDVHFDSHYTFFSSSPVFIEVPFSVFHGR